MGIKDEEEKKIIKADLAKNFSFVPVFMEEDVADLHYNGFSNKIIWPLFHYLPGEVNFHDLEWEAYQKANQAFAETIAEVAQEGDIIWIHDYHLMLVPQMLRDLTSQKIHLNIGYFLHIPFPSSEIYGILPVRKQILQGLLGADLIGFHTFDYVRHFLSSGARILGLDSSPNGIEYDGRKVKIGCFPIGIDPAKFVDALTDSKVQERISFLKGIFKDKKILVGVERLDYIKGVPHKLQGLEVFFEKYPEFQEKVVLIQVAVPSRIDVEEYKNLRSTVNELVGRINGRFGTFEYTPIHFLNKSISFEELVALYAIADAFVVSSTRDGMNLVSYEYIACQKGNHGVLILSEFAGAAHSLYGSIVINPWNIDQLASAYYEALTMSDEAKKNSHEKLFNYISKHTAAYWGESFIEELKSVCKDNAAKKIVPKLNFSHLQREWMMTDKKLLIIDNELLRPEDLSIIDPSADLLIISEKEKEFLFPYCGMKNVYIGAENGSLFYDCGQGEWQRLLEDNLDCTWKESVKSLFSHYTERTPGSKIEEREFDLIWNYREADLEYGNWHASELQLGLEKILANSSIGVFVENFSLNARPFSMEKSLAAKHLLKTHSYDLIVGIGAGKSFEPVIKLINSYEKKHISCSVGKKEGEALFYTHSVHEILKVFKSSLECKR